MAERATGPKDDRVFSVLDISGRDPKMRELAASTLERFNLSQEVSLIRAFVLGLRECTDSSDRNFQALSLLSTIRDRYTDMIINLSPNRNVRWRCYQLSQSDNGVFSPEVFCRDLDTVVTRIQSDLGQDRAHGDEIFALFEFIGSSAYSLYEAVSERKRGFES